MDNPKQYGSGRRPQWKTACLLLLFLSVTMFAKTKVHSTKLLNFNGLNGVYPNPLVQGTDGNLYGSTFGSISGPPHHHYYSGGMIFKMTPAGEQTILYTFCIHGPCLDGDGPYSRLVLATDGDFYGTTSYGGANSSPGVWGGTFFKITTAGVLTTLYSFCSLTACFDGSYPGQLVQGSDGDFYGTTIQGGANANGTIFRINARGKLTTLYSFCSLLNCADGTNANDGGVSSGLIEATDGRFYGTTGGGGLYNGGTVFRITPHGELATLYSFCLQGNCIDGDNPLGGVTQGNDGNFYGSTYGGGIGILPVGTVFRITPTGTLTTLYSFCVERNCADGSLPATVPILGDDGNLYGTTSFTDYRITPAGALETLHQMPATYANPDTTLLQATSGVFYGATPQGGNGGLGTIYTMAVDGIGPFVESVRPSGKVGKTILILGQDFTGTTGVYFDGTSASYNVLSGTCLSATVPSGATTGPHYCFDSKRKS